MLVSHSKKIAVHFNPKTGSQSLYNFFLGCGLDVCVFSSGHETFDEEGYSLYAFYRNPVDRFVSAVNHVRKVQKHIELHIYEKVNNVSISAEEAEVAYGKSPSENPYKVPVSDWIDFLEDIRQNSNSEIYNQTLVSFRDQIEWLDKENLTLLNFHDIDNEVIKLATAFGVTPNSLPHSNKSVDGILVSDLIEEEINKIKQYHQKDIEFFNNRNISFS